ncbi:MAG TPA: hypothetical protein VF704_09465 [Allosphingosinicella sp.]|jgi:hypothetical protein
MGFYRTTFIVAFLLIGLAVALAFLPEIRELVGRLRRRPKEERHVIRVEKEVPGTRPARPTLKREEDRDQG